MPFALLMKDLMLLASWTTSMFLNWFINRCKLALPMLEISVFSSEKETLDRMMVETRITIIILSRKTRFAGVFLSPRAFLKSLMMLLKF